MFSQVHDTYFLVAIIDNDYVDSILFDIFDEVIACDQEIRREQHEQETEGLTKTVDTASEAATEWF